MFLTVDFFYGSSINHVMPKGGGESGQTLLRIFKSNRTDFDQKCYMGDGGRGGQKRPNFLLLFLYWSFSFFFFTYFSVSELECFTEVFDLVLSVFSEVRN